MKTLGFLLAIVGFGAILALQTVSAEPLQVRLVDALDEPEYYCLDLSGWGDHLKLDDPLQAHTCKVRDPADQLFTLVDGKITVGETDRCLGAAVSSGKPLPGSAIVARTCSDSPLQVMNLQENGQIRVGDTDVCLAAGAESTDASGPSHVWRVLSVQYCDSIDPARSTWQVGLN